MLFMLLEQGPSGAKGVRAAGKVVFIVIKCVFELGFGFDLWDRIP